MVLESTRESNLKETRRRWPTVRLELQCGHGFILQIVKFKNAGKETHAR